MYELDAICKRNDSLSHLISAEEYEGPRKQLEYLIDSKLTLLRKDYTRGIRDRQRRNRARLFYPGRGTREEMRRIFMGILSRIFKRGAPESAPQEMLDAVCRFSDMITNDFGKDAFDTDGIEKQILLAYVYGAVVGLAVVEELPRPRSHAVLRAVLHNHFGYSFEESAAKAQELIEAGSMGRQNSLYGAIHQGINSFKVWLVDSESPESRNSASRSFASVVDRFRMLTTEEQKNR